MRKLIATVLFATLTVATWAQEVSTNALNTEIENFEAQTNTILVKAYGPVGSVSVSSGTFTIDCKETSDISHGRKKYGAVVELSGQSPFRQVAILDEDELDSLADGLDYLTKLSYDVSTLPAFTAEYATKSGLRFAAHSSRKQSGIQYYLQVGDGSRIPLNSSQLGQLSNLINQTHAAINALKAPR